jgi:manganese transport protein
MCQDFYVQICRSLQKELFLLYWYTGSKFEIIKRAIMSTTNQKSLDHINESVDLTQSSHKSWRHIFAFLGPAYLVSVGYMDPGNWATDLAGGSEFGYSLLWVLLLSNIIALVMQTMAAKVGLVYRQDLIQLSAKVYPKWLNYICYGISEIGIAATDLAEVLGLAIGLQLLFGIPLVWGVTITIADTFLLILLEQWGMRKLEAFIISLVAIIAIAFVIELGLDIPQWSAVAAGFIPHLPNQRALYIALGIIGATVMPHNIYLHSSLVQTRKILLTPQALKKAIKMNNIDSAIALNLAFLINCAILILAGTVFFGKHTVGSIEQAYKLLEPLLGTKLAPILFATALIAAGQSSTITGTLSGQIVMEGYMNWHLSPWLRRIITRLFAVAPALIVLIVLGDQSVDQMLILSQVILSFQLGFILIPLLYFASNKSAMGNFVIKPLTHIIAGLMVITLIVLSMTMLILEIYPYLQHISPVWSFFFWIGFIFTIFCLVILYVYPQKHPYVVDTN